VSAQTVTRRYTDLRWLILHHAFRLRARARLPRILRKWPKRARVVANRRQHPLCCQICRMRKPVCRRQPHPICGVRHEPLHRQLRSKQRHVPLASKPRTSQRVVWLEQPELWRRRVLGHIVLDGVASVVWRVCTVPRDAHQRQPHCLFFLLRHHHMHLPWVHHPGDAVGQRPALILWALQLCLHTSALPRPDRHDGGRGPSSSGRRRPQRLQLWGRVWLCAARSLVHPRPGSGSLQPDDRAGLVSHLDAGALGHMSVHPRVPLHLARATQHGHGVRQWGQQRRLFLGRGTDRQFVVPHQLQRRVVHTRRLHDDVRADNRERSMEESRRARHATHPSERSVSPCCGVWTLHCQRQCTESAYCGPRRRLCLGLQ
jgi:hypothetical protein